MLGVKIGLALPAHGAGLSVDCDVLWRPPFLGLGFGTWMLMHLALRVVW